jgi:AcrR family transcriptional regulator
VTRTERTRAALLEAALTLFTEQGFEETTVAQIAARAGVTEMTFYRHFGTKDAVLVDDPYDPLIADAVRGATAPTPLAAAAEGVLSAWRSVPEPAVDIVRDRLRLVARTPSLRGAMAVASRGTEDAITAALEARGEASLEARIASAATVAALNAALIAWAEGPETPLATAIEAAARVLAAR